MELQPPITALALLLALFIGQTKATGLDAPEAHPDLISLLQHATYCWTFDSKNFKADWGTGVRVEAGDNFSFEQRAKGAALSASEGGELKLRGSKLGDFSRPGAICFWVSPKGWNWGDSRGNHYLFSAFTAAPEAHLMIMRQGHIAEAGRGIVRSENLSFYIGGFPGLQEHFILTVAEPNQESWGSETWHCLLLSWDGISFTLYLDGQISQTASLPEPLLSKSEKPLSFANCSETTLFDHLIIFNRALTSEEAKLLFATTRPH